MERKIEITQIMINRSATGHSSNDFYFLLLHIIQINFRQGILKFPHNNGGCIHIKQENIFRRKTVKEVFFGSDIEIGVVRRGVDEEHGWVLDTKLRELIESRTRYHSRKNFRSRLRFSFSGKFLPKNGCSSEYMTLIVEKCELFKSQCVIWGILYF